MRHGTKGWAGVLLACGALAGVSVTPAAATTTAPTGTGAAIVFSGVLSGTLVVKPPPNSACYVQPSHHTFTVTLEGSVHHVPVLLSVTVGPYRHPHTYRIRPVSAAKGIPVEVSIEGGGHVGLWIPTKRSSTLALNAKGRGGRFDLHLGSPAASGSLTVKGPFVCPNFVTEGG